MSRARLYCGASLSAIQHSNNAIRHDRMVELTRLGEEIEGDVIVTEADRPAIFSMLEDISHDSGYGAGHQNYSIPIEWAGYLDLAHEASAAELTEDERQTLAIGEEQDSLAIATRNSRLSRLHHLFAAFFEDFDGDHRPEDMA